MPCSGTSRGLSAAPIVFSLIQSGSESRTQATESRVKQLGRLVLSTATLLAALVVGEGGLRLVDGVPLDRLEAVPASPVPASRRDRERGRRLVAELSVSPGVERSWYDLDPPPLAAQPIDSAMAARAGAYRAFGLPALYEWNRAYLTKLACDDPPAFAQQFGPLESVFVFEAVGGDPFPTFRFLRHAAYPSRLITNAFGWRGPEVALDKPKRTVRIAFVGASTTAGFHAAPFSYPEYLETWLNQWSDAGGLGVRFETLNAAREGINSTSIAAVVSQEVAPLEPDMVVYYEGSNQFWPSSYVDWPGGVVPVRPRIDPRAPWRLERISVAAVRLHLLLDAWRNTGAEPKKPQLPVLWPADLDEGDPALDATNLPINLPTILRDLSRIRTSAREAGGELAVASFMWFVWDGMYLDRSRHGSVFHYLNETFWPFRYAHLRRFADFQNRVLAKFAVSHGEVFLDFASAFPRDVAFMSDAIHFTPEGMRLQAWVMFQQLLPVIDQRIKQGRWPQADRRPARVHPAFAQPDRLLEPVSGFAAACSKDPAR